jgi:hypothetical protein
VEGEGVSPIAMTVSRITEEVINIDFSFIFSYISPADDNFQKLELPPICCAKMLNLTLVPLTPYFVA